VTNPALAMMWITSRVVAPPGAKDSSANSAIAAAIAIVKPQVSALARLASVTSSFISSRTSRERNQKPPVTRPARITVASMIQPLLRTRSTVRRRSPELKNAACWISTNTASTGSMRARRRLSRSAISTLESGMI
jgi:hypothetical protein